MSTLVGVGFSENPDSYAAGRDAAQTALVHGQLQRCDLLLVFATSRQNAVRLRAGFRAAVGPDTRIVGGNVIGALTNEALGYDGYQVAVAAFEFGDARCDLHRVPGLPDNEKQVGNQLGQVITEGGVPEDASILLMYDSMNHTGAQPKLNMATPLLAGLRPYFPHPPRLVGIGQCGDTPRDPVHQWFDDAVESQSAQAVVFSGNLRLDTVVMHGCKPIGSYREVTKSDGPVVLEIDGRPALEVIGEILGPDSGYTVADYRFFVTLGVNKGEKFGPYREENYANRLCCGVDEARGGLVMFEPDLVAGTSVQLMRRSVNFDYIESRTQDLLSRLESRRPVLALYINCAGRAAAYSGSEVEDAAEVQRVIGSRIPLLGVYCGVEVAQVGSDLQALDWSGVLCIFSEEV